MTIEERLKELGLELPSRKLCSSPPDWESPVHFGHGPIRRLAKGQGGHGGQPG